MEQYGILKRDTFSTFHQLLNKWATIGNTVSSRRAVTSGIPQGSSLGPVLFLIYINDLPNYSSLLAFGIFADDTYIFASAHDLKSLEQLINTELKKFKLGAMLTSYQLIQFSRTNFKIVKSPRKRDLAVTIKIESEDGTSSLLERKDRVKYLGVLQYPLNIIYPMSHHEFPAALG